MNEKAQHDEQNSTGSEREKSSHRGQRTGERGENDCLRGYIARIPMGYTGCNTRAMAWLPRSYRSISRASRLRPSAVGL
jgi:hypothetical protein